MAKKIRPSLKDYLRTGVVRFNDDGEPAAASPLADGCSPSSALLALLSKYQLEYGISDEWGKMYFRADMDDNFGGKVNFYFNTTENKEYDWYVAALLAKADLYQLKGLPIHSVTGMRDLSALVGSTA